LVKAVYQEKAYEVVEFEAEERETLSLFLADEEAYGIN
ncbi:MAG: UDP-3-O-[3-hydroxymyristoyl] N-acetylglucosamine deacetylase, partial [Desulfurobacterium sp.]